jgi:hypothetical protein
MNNIDESIEDGSYRPEQYHDGMTMRIQRGEGERNGNYSKWVFAIVFTLTITVVILSNR